MQLGPADPNSSLEFTQGLVQVPPGAVVNATRLTNFEFSTIDVSGTGQFDAPAVENISGARFFVRDGATVELNNVFGYNAFFYADFNFYQEEPPAFRAEGVGSKLLLPNVRTIEVALGQPGLQGTGRIGEITATGGGLIDLSGLERLNADQPAAFRIRTQPQSS